MWCTWHDFLRPLIVGRWRGGLGVSPHKPTDTQTQTAWSWAASANQARETRTNNNTPWLQKPTLLAWKRTCSGEGFINFKGVFVGLLGVCSFKRTWLLSDDETIGFTAALTHLSQLTAQTLRAEAFCGVQTSASLIWTPQIYQQDTPALVPPSDYSVKRRVMIGARYDEGRVCGLTEMLKFGGDQWETSNAAKN